MITNLRSVDSWGSAFRGRKTSYQAGYRGDGIDVEGVVVSRGITSVVIISIVALMGCGDEAEHPSSWPVMVPDEDVKILDLDTGLISTQSIYEAFNQPSTPTLQIYRSDGSVESLEHSYWADWDELVDIVKILDGK